MGFSATAIAQRQPEMAAETGDTKCTHRTLTCDVGEGGWCRLQWTMFPGSVDSFWWSTTRPDDVPASHWAECSSSPCISLRSVPADNDEALGETDRTQSKTLLTVEKEHWRRQLWGTGVRAPPPRLRVARFFWSHGAKHWQKVDNKISQH